jgi:amino acid adenylation domain-containing protein
MTSRTDLSSLTSDQQRALLQQLLQQKATRARRYPMSIGQQGLWHAFRRDPTCTSFNVFLPTRMRARLDVQALRSAMEWVAARHSCLHTVFSDTGGELLQFVKPGLQPDFTIDDLAGSSAEQARAAVGQRVRQAFDLERGPLLRVHCIRIADNDWIVLALTHHIVVDFWSLIIILNELRQAYPAFASQQLPTVSAAQNNYAQFVADQRALLSSPSGDVHRQYWQSVVQQASPVLELPTDNLRPPVFDNAAISTPLEFPDSLVPRITALASRNRSTPFSVMQAAVQVFLGRYSGQNKFLIGSPFSGRRQHEYEQTVGFFINMLPLLADVDGELTFSQLVVRTSRHLLDALEHEAYPIAQIVHDAQLDRDPGRMPLFQVSCTFEKAQVKSEAGRASFLFPNQHAVWDFGGLPQESFYVPHPTCHYDLEFIFEQTDTRLRGMLVACEALFASATLRSMAVNFSALLQTLIEHPECPVAGLPWPAQSTPTALPSMAVNTAAEQAISPAANETSTAVNETVVELLATAVAQHAHRCALQFGQHTLTYAQLWRIADRIAAAVRHRFERSEAVAPTKVQPLLGASAVAPPIVPICTASGPLAFIGMLGVQRAGAASVAIDLNQPAINAADLQRELAPRCWLGHPRDAYARDLNQDVCIDLEQVLNTHPRSETDTNPTSADIFPTAADLAYMVYTSGSTGAPKGVLIEHAAICNTLRWRQRDVPLQPSDRVLMLLSHQFDAALGIAWTTLTQGATLVWAEPTLPRDPQLLIEQIVRESITVLPAIPSLLRVLVAHPDFVRCTSLRLIFCGGEAIPCDLPSQLRQVSNARLWNFYGPSEAAVEASAMDVTEHCARSNVPIGYPIRHTEIVVVDSSQQPVPDTVPGELAIVGHGLARGYLNAPELNELKFRRLTCDVQAPSGLIPQGTRMYLTGDRGRRLASGQIEFLGRTDEQIKLRGYRIELGEIEAVLQAHPQVKRAAVQVVSAGTPSAQLVAYVSLLNPSPAPRLDSPTSPPSDASLAIQRFLSDRLPSFKLPSAVMFLDSLPLTTSGKVDRSRLPHTHPASPFRREFMAPKTTLEKWIAKAWCEILQTESVSVDTNFFDAGGSSLGAAMLTTQLSQDLGIHVPTALLFDLADVRQVATRLAQLHAQTLTERFGLAAIEEQLCIAQTSDSPPSTVSSSGPADSTAVALSRADLHPLLAPLKLSGARPPLFLVHPPGGIVVCYRDLAQHLATDLPLVAIRARGLHGAEQLPDSMETMAADYLQAIRSVQPEGPYTLGGWSLGGLVAYELAQQVLRSGQALSRLILLDTTIPEGATPWVPASEVMNVGMEYGIELNLEQLGQLPATEQLQYLWEHAKQLGVIADAAPAEVVTRVLEDLRSLFHHHVKLANAYRLAPLAGHIDLFRPSETPCELRVAADRGWRHVAQRVTVHFVPGQHHSMVQSPHAEHLARRLNWAALGLVPDWSYASSSGATISNSSTAGSPSQ